MVKMPSVPVSLLIAGGVIGGALLYVRIVGARNAGATVGGAVVDFADGVVGSAVIGLGSLVGIQPTNESECARAKREGRTWDASFACPAREFLEYLFEGSSE